MSVILADFSGYVLNGFHSLMSAISDSAGKRCGNERRLEDRIHDRKDRMMQNPVLYCGFMDVALFRIGDIEARVWAMTIRFPNQFTMELKDIFFKLPLKLQNIRSVPFILLKYIPGRKEIFGGNYLLKNVFVNSHKQ
jgi:hypothetical protein